MNFKGTSYPNYQTGATSLVFSVSYNDSSVCVVNPVVTISQDFVEGKG